jgi:transposase
VLDIVGLIAYTTGGRPGSRVLERLAIPVTDDTVLRTLKRAFDVEPDRDPVRRLGVDDWAWRKGQTYGTILVDLERHRVVDLLPDRSAESFQGWLLKHPAIDVISRDRCRLYAEGANAGAPDAVQVADRFHLLVNLSAAIERAMEEHRSELELPAPERAGPAQSPEHSPALTQPTRQQLSKEHRRQRRLESYQKVVELDRLGYTQKAISEELNIERKTVRRWLRSGQFPERKTPVRKPSAVQQYAEYLEQRWSQGCHNATALFREIRTRGYTGRRGMVAQYISRWRVTGTSERADRPQRIAPKHAAILVTKPPERLSDEQRRSCEQLITHCPATGLMRALAQDFRQVLLSKDETAMLDWIRNATQSGIGPVVRFAFGLRSELKPVLAAVTTTWSNGQTEGHVNRLKTIKRQMYGRAGFALLRRRVLPFTSVASP